MSTQTTVEPVRRTVSVARPVEDAFRVFTEEIGRWWPLETHSRAAGRDGVEAEAAVLEGRVGGRLYERVSDGTEADWGRITAWEPPHRVAFEWHITGLPTEVDVRFARDGDGTRVELEHRGFERIDDGAARRASYTSGWGSVLARYAAFAG
jgi:uncharacterized protein YndB with AHSA1/START domain